MMVYDIEHPEELAIVAWRKSCFDPYFSELEAFALALRRDLDRADVEALVMAGCEPGLAAEILL